MLVIGVLFKLLIDGFLLESPICNSLNLDCFLFLKIDFDVSVFSYSTCFLKEKEEDIMDIVQFGMLVK